MLERIKEISERLKAATSGDWIYQYGNIEALGPVSKKGHRTASSIAIMRNESIAERDAQFIAHAPADIAFLLDALREAEAALNNAKAGGCFCLKTPEFEDSHLGTCPQMLTNMNQAFANRVKDLIARAEKAESALRDATERLGRAEKVIEASDILASWAMCAREDRRVKSDSEPMVAQTLAWTVGLIQRADDQRVLRSGYDAAPTGERA